MVELATVINHFKNGNYSYVSNNGRNYLALSHLFFGSLILKSMRRILRKYIVSIFRKPSNLFRKPNHQVINIVNPPDSSSLEAPDICDACPDAVLYEGKMQPSCILESIKQFQKKTEIK